MRIDKISDDRGSIGIGQPSAGVLFARFLGRVDGLCEKYDGLLERCVREPRAIHIFCDTGRLKAPIFSLRLVLKPLFDRVATPLSISLLANSMLVTIAARSMAALHNCDI